MVDRQKINTYLADNGFVMTGNAVYMDMPSETWEVLPSEKAVVLSVSLVNAHFDPAGVRLNRFRKNPVVLYAHDYSGFPVAKSTWERVRVNDDHVELVAKVQFHLNTELSREVWALVEKGVLSAWSIGIVPQEWEPSPEGKGFLVTKWDLIECSCVSRKSDHVALGYELHERHITAPSLVKSLALLGIERQAAPIEPVDRDKVEIYEKKETLLAGGLVRVFKDGDQWCALYGKDLMEGKAGFGDTEMAAVKGLFSALGRDGSDSRWLLNQEPEVYLGDGLWTSLARVIVDMHCDEVLEEHATEIERLRKELAATKETLAALEEESDTRATINDLKKKLAEAESKIVLTRAEADGAGSLLLDVQADCISDKQRAEKAEAERDELKGKLADWQETHNNIIAERCAPDEVHCTCVPSLRKRIQELEAKLAEAESKVVLTRAEADGAGSLLLDVQADCISEKQRADKLEAACAAYRRALEIEACETRMRIGRVGEDCDDHLCPLESGDCYGRWAADVLKANPAGAAMLEVVKAAEEWDKEEPSQWGEMAATRTLHQKVRALQGRGSDEPTRTSTRRSGIANV